jgi:cyclopropane-fatty-acyl-phospholipid synthase
VSEARRPNVSLLKHLPSTERKRRSRYPTLSARKNYAIIIQMKKAKTAKTTRKTKKSLKPISVKPKPFKVNKLAAPIYKCWEIAMSEGYVAGIEVSDKALRKIMQKCVATTMRKHPNWLVPYPWVNEESDLLAEGSQDLMKVQYNLPQPMLNTMLGDGEPIYPKYSMGLWDKGAKTLEKSQKDMIDDVIRKAGIKDGDTILDFGCGWGCVPNYILSKLPNVRITGINLSSEQCGYIRKKMKDPKSNLSSKRFKLIEGDVNKVVIKQKFDKIISIGVFCHIGNLTKTFKRLSELLKDDGKVFIHIITVNMPTNLTSPFTHKYIFPHGRIWNHDAVPAHNEDLVTVDRWYLNGRNYSETLKAWLKNFDDNQEMVSKLDYGMPYRKFRRIWRLYLIAVQENFANNGGKVQGNGQYLLVKAKTIK